MIDAVLFDLDDTLHDDTDTYRRAAADAAREAALECALDPDRLLANYIREAERFWRQLSQDHLGTNLAGVRERMWAAALAECGVSDEGVAVRCAAAYIRHRRKYLKLWPGVAELLAHLRAEGSKLGLITNGFAETHHEKIALLGLAESFDAILIADEVGMVKPDPRMFAHACALLGVAPQRAVMVGDRYHRDVTGAHAAGLRTIWLDIHAERIPEGGPLPDATVSQIADVGDALQTLRARHGRQ